MIGEIDEIEVKNFRITERRFEIESEEVASNSGFLKIESLNKHDALFIISNVKLQLYVECKAKLIIPNISWISAEKFRIRVESEILSFSLSSSEGFCNWQFKPDWNQHKSWSEIRNDIHLIEMLSFGESKINCFVGGEQFAEGKISSRRSRDLYRLDNLHAMVEAIDRISRIPSISVFLRLSLREIQAIVQHDNDIMYLISNSNSNKIIINVEIDKKSSISYSDTKFVLPLIFRCDGKFIAAALFVEGKIKRITGKKLNMVVKNTNIDLAACFEGEALAINHLKLRVRQIADDSTEDEFIVVHKSIWHSSDEPSHLLGLK